MKKIFALALILVFTLTASALAEPFRVGMECGYAPFNWAQVEQTEGSVAIEGNQGYADGYDVQIAKKVAEGLNRELVIVKIEWDGLIPALNSGMIDAVIAGMSPTEERKLSVLFTDNYYNSDLVIVVRNDGPYANVSQLSDFAGARITGQQNTFHYTVIDQIEGVEKMTAMESFPSMIVALNAGVIDGYISERPGAESACAANPNLAYVDFGEDGFVTSEDDTAIAIALKLTDTELCEQINGILSTIDNDTRLALMTQALADQPGAAE